MREFDIKLYEALERMEPVEDIIYNICYIFIMIMKYGAVFFSMSMTFYAVIASTELTSCSMLLMVPLSVRVVIALLLMPAAYKFWNKFFNNFMWR